jgi:hypothetical protein
MESETIGFVKTRCPYIPAPEVPLSWVDPEGNRMFLITKRWARRQLCQMWPSFSQSQKAELIAEVVGYCKDLARLTSSKLETATVKAVLDMHLNYDTLEIHPI